MTTPNSEARWHDFKRYEGSKETEVLGGKFDKNNYQSKRVWAEARDGKKVPVSLVYRKDMFNEGQNHFFYTVMAHMGSQTMRALALLAKSSWQRFCLCNCHIRGSQYLGRGWYDDGKMFKKKNTFNDFIDAGKFLIKEGYANENKLFAMEEVLVDYPRVQLQIWLLNFSRE